MHISDQSKIYFDWAKMKLPSHFDQRPIGCYFEPVAVFITYTNYQVYGMMQHSMCSQYVR